MPGANHNHPDYEQTFTRNATILDVLAQEQLATERTLREFITQTTSSLNGTNLTP